MYTDNTIVVYKGNKILQISENLLTKQDAWDNLERINALHVERLELEDKILDIDDPKVLSTLDVLYSTLELELQEAWGFPMDAKFHKFWNRPKCRCPKMDNNERYPHGRYIVNGDCPLHGEVK